MMMMMVVGVKRWEEERMVDSYCVIAFSAAELHFLLLLLLLHSFLLSSLRATERSNDTARPIKRSQIFTLQKGESDSESGLTSVITLLPTAKKINSKCV